MVTGRAALFLQTGRTLPPVGNLRSSGKRGLAVQNEQFLVVRESRSECIVLVLKPHKLGFQVANALLETTHLGEHARVRAANVAE
jgi:hypothetical protein